MIYLSKIIAFCFIGIIVFAACENFTPTLPEDRRLRLSNNRSISLTHDTSFYNPALVWHSRNHDSLRAVAKAQNKVYITYFNTYSPSLYYSYLDDLLDEDIAVNIFLNKYCILFAANTDSIQKIKDGKNFMVLLLLNLPLSNTPHFGLIDLS